MFRNVTVSVFASGLALVVVCLAVAGAAPAAGQDAGGVVTVEGGQLAGAPSPLGDEVMVYRGVPFAARRWAICGGVPPSRRRRGTACATRRRRPRRACRTRCPPR